MGPIVWWDLLWVTLVVLNISLWFWADADNRSAQKLLSRAELMIEGHQKDLEERHTMAQQILEEAKTFLTRAEVLARPRSD